MTANNSTKPTVWKIESLVAALGGYNEEKNKISIPKFQRTLVWGRDQQKEFIDSIKNGFPVGAILLYKSTEKDGQTTYNLIDGLQRSTALSKYMQSPTQFFDETNLTQDVVNIIFNYISGKNLSVTKENVIEQTIKWINELGGFKETDGFSSSDLAASLDESLQLDLSKEESRELTKRIVPELDKIKSDSDITKVELPVLVYYGEQSNLPLIFQRLNSKGTQLSKYQIYAATWISYNTFKIKNTDIIKGIKLKYESLIEEGYEVDGYESSKFTSSDFSVFEYLFGLGKLLCEKYSYLFGTSSKSEQEDSIGFNIMNICLNLPFDKMHELPEVFLKKDVQKLENALLDSIEFVFNCLKGHITLKMNKRRKIPIVHSEYQIVSMIGKVFNCKYDKEFNENTGWKTSKEKLINNLEYYYLYDIIRNFWRGTGDTKAYELANNDRYEITIEKKSWESALDEWFREEMQKREFGRKRIPDVSILFYKYLYTYSLTAYEELSGIEYDIEHLVPVDRLNDIKGTKGIPINVFPNLCLLDSKLNNQKKALTFYEYFDKQVSDGELTPPQADLEIEKVEKYSHTLRADLNFVNNSMTFNEKEYRNFLNNRYDKVKDLFFKFNNIT